MALYVSGGGVAAPIPEAGLKPPLDSAEGRLPTKSYS
jgi:hypothetical protein